jgi:hypothetical protein
LVGVASQGISVQDAQRQGAFVRFGMTPAELADEKKQQELLLAIKSANDDSIWGVNFGGDVVKVPDSVYTQLKSSN